MYMNVFFICILHMDFFYLVPQQYSTFTGETKHRYTLTVNPVPGSPLESIPPDSPKVKCFFYLSHLCVNTIEINQIGLHFVNLVQ